MMEYIVSMLAAAIFGVCYAVVFILYNKQKNSGCVSKDSADIHGCAHCGACGIHERKKDNKNESGSPLE